MPSLEAPVDLTPGAQVSPKTIAKKLQKKKGGKKSINKHIYPQGRVYSLRGHLQLLPLLAAQKETNPKVPKTVF
jgi:hypothetical protein